MEHAINQLIAVTYTGFAGWLGERAGLDPERAEAVATVGLGALFSSRLLRLLLGRDPITVDDAVFVDTWVQMIHRQLTADD